MISCPQYCGVIHRVTGVIHNPWNFVINLTKAATRRKWIRKCQWPSVQYSYTNNERQKMIVEHNLKFVTEFADNHPVTQQVMALDENTRIFMLESMLKDLVAPRLQPILDEINANGSYAILKVAE